MANKETHEVIILGAGPAGFTAGIYLGRFDISTLLLETMDISPTAHGYQGGRSAISGKYHNIPGFPEGVGREEFKWRGIQQAVHNGCEHRLDEILEITRDGILFHVRSTTQTYLARTLFFALGTRDSWPDIPEVDAYIGQCLFWSVEANGFEAKGKFAAVVGTDDHAALEALRLFLMHGQSAIFTHGQALKISAPLAKALEQCHIPIYTAPIQKVEGDQSQMSGLKLATGETIPIQILFHPTPVRLPCSQLAEALGVHVDAAGFIQVNGRFETNIPHIYAIGDITARGREQVITACYQGMEAAWAYYDDRFHHTTHLMFNFPEDNALSRYQSIRMPSGS